MLSRLPAATTLDLQRSVPGLAFCALVGAVSTALASYIGSGVVWALLIGIAIASVWTVPQALEPGVAIAAKQVLRLGVALLGFQISAATLHVLDAVTICALTVNVLLILGAGYLIGPRIGLGRDLSLVLAASIAICGASAAAAFALAVPRDKLSHRDLGCTIGIVSLLSLAAMLIYPLLARFLGLDAVDAGVLLGGSIQEVVHAVGAGYSIDAATGDIATVTKLLRVALLAPALMLVVSLRGESTDGAPIPRPPLFLVGFVVFAIFGAMGLVPSAVADTAAFASRFFLLMAMAAIGVMLPWRSVFSYGWRPVFLLLLLSMLLLVLMIAFVWRPHF